MLMKITIPFILVLLCCVEKTQGDVDGYGPWKFGMSRKAVTSIDKFGPYKSVAVTKGVETYNAQWDGKKANLSFIFKDGKLNKIQIWAYEGKDQTAALNAWWRVAVFLRKTHGGLEFKQFPKLSPAVAEEDFLKHFKTVLDAGKIAHFQMGLKKMPKGATVYSSFFVHSKHGYFVFLYYRQS